MLKSRRRRVRHVPKAREPVFCHGFKMMGSITHTQNEPMAQGRTVEPLLRSGYLDTHGEAGGGAVWRQVGQHVDQHTGHC